MNPMKKNPSAQSFTNQPKLKKKCNNIYDFVFIILRFIFFQMNSRDEQEKTFKVAMPENSYATVYLRDAMSVEEFLASACARKNLNPMEHFVRVKKRRDMEDHNYFVPHRNDLIESYVSIISFMYILPHIVLYTGEIFVFCGGGLMIKFLDTFIVFSQRFLLFRFHQKPK